MTRAKLIATACFTVLIGVLTLMTARAQDFTGLEKTYLTFSGPVELPNLTLQRGTYLFKRPDANSARIIQVFSENGKEILGTFQTIPAHRLEVTSENVVTFKENREGQMPAVQYWYYPGRETGHEFLYPKSQAMQIAARTGEAVMTSEGEVSANSAAIEANPVGDLDDSANANADLNASADSDAAAVDVDVNRQASATTSQAEPDSQIASNDDLNQDASAAAPVGTSGQSEPGAVGTSGQSDADAQAIGNELPSTASPLPLTGLISLLSLGGAAAIRRFRK